MAEPSPIPRMVLALTTVAVLAALLLAMTHLVTRQPILQAQRAMLHASLRQVLPPHANDPLDDVVHVAGRSIHIARDRHGHILGLAWEAVAPDGYAGPIRILVGVRPDGRILAIRVTEHQETPGLGDGIAHNRRWLASFRGASRDNRRWDVKKDGGDFDQFTGATISPRAVVHAVRRALDFLAAHRRAILARAARPHLVGPRKKETLAP